VQPAPAAVAPPAGNPRFPLLDSVRALAIFGVIVCHAATYTGTWPDEWWGTTRTTA
jgi:peptidoglycan/LPS O-acetylase OafA/YrhL